jgi:hypothetical protein
MRYTVRPISDRTAFTGAHEYSPFRTNWADTLQLLDRELTALKAAEIVIEVDVAGEGQIRLDGMLRSDAKVLSPAVRIAFDSRHGPLTYATDRYTSRYYNDPEDWKQNVRAIALGLEALRKVDRYGITKRGEQYAGWKQIGIGPIALGAGLSREQAIATIAKAAQMSRPGADLRMVSAMVTGEDESVAQAVRWAKAGAHPDRNGGDRALWDQVEQAARVLGIAS